jgi:hypothetical protein
LNWVGVESAGYKRLRLFNRETTVRAHTPDEFSLLAQAGRRDFSTLLSAVATTGLTQVVGV